MKLKSSTLFLLSALLVYACGGSDDENADAGDGDGDSETPGDGDMVVDAGQAALVVPPIDFGLDLERSLTTLSDDEIGGACDNMASILSKADEGIACQISAAAAESSEGDCVTARDTCLKAPTDALAATGIRTSPAPIDCSKFDAELTADCDYPIALLQDCANAMAQSVVPAAQAVSCPQAAEVDDLKSANMAATADLNYSFAAVCADLLECEALVGALLGGDNSGAGGAPGN